ncbi:MAG: hypothetical protein AAF892_12965, partial [Cyanobacteria bacterium P01_D01_bin.71]
RTAFNFLTTYHGHIRQVQKIVEIEIHRLHLPSCMTLYNHHTNLRRAIIALAAIEILLNNPRYHPKTGLESEQINC